MRKREREQEARDLEQAEEAIKRSESMRKDILLSRGMDSFGEEESMSGKIEGMVEAVHQVSRMDKGKAAERMLAGLKKRDRKKKMTRLGWYAGGSVAATIVMLFAVTTWLRTAVKEKSPVIALTEIKVPTLITMEDDHEILSQETLDLQETGNGYFVGKETKGALEKEQDEITGMETPLRYNRIVIPAGFTYKVQLSDGSVVTLNAGSELKFPEEFRDSIREVEFSGEGYFEVDKSDKPFIVKSGKTQVKVYGTRFNLFYCEKLALSEAILVEGSIGMIVGSTEMKIVPNQRVYCSLNDSLVRAEEVDPADYIGWMENSFKYNRVRLDKIIFDISQWYGVEIELAPGLEKETFSLEFDKSSSIDWVVRALGQIIDKPVKTEGGVYHIE